MSSTVVIYAGIISRSIQALHHNSERIEALASVLRVAGDCDLPAEAQEQVDLTVATLEQLAREHRESEVEEQAEHERAARTSARYRRAYSEGAL